MYQESTSIIESHKSITYLILKNRLIAYDLKPSKKSSLVLLPSSNLSTLTCDTALRASAISIPFKLVHTFTRPKN